MIDRKIVQSVRNSTCAIGYVTTPLEEFIAEPDQPSFKVVGTGFLVSRNRVMTNRHVVRGLMEALAEHGLPNSQRVLMFVQPTKPGRWKIHIARLLEMGYVQNAAVDVGIAEFEPPTAQEFDSVKPLAFQSQMIYEIGEPVVVCGYPFGHMMLEKGGRVYRWGPVLQQGYISAISPFDNTNQPTELLLDIRIAPGMSGAAVLRPLDGTVIGIVHSLWESTTAVALPLGLAQLARLMQSHDAQREKAA